MYYVITDKKVYSSKSLKTINKEMNGLLELDEFNQIGGDLVVCMTSNDIDFVQDKKKVSSIMFGNFFKKDNSVKMISIVNLVFVFICFIRLMSLGG